MEGSSELVRTFLLAEDFDTHHRLLREHPELLQPETDSELLVLALRERRYHVQETCRVILALARKIGVEPAFGLLHQVRRLQDAARTDRSRIPELEATYQRIFGHLLLEYHVSAYTVVCYELAGLYIAAWEETDVEDHLHRAIDYFNKAIDLCSDVNPPFDIGQAWNNLGYAYSNLRTGDRAKNLKRAKACYQRVVQQGPFTSVTERARAHIHLGAVKSERRAGGNRREQLEEALLHYQEALQTLDATQFPLEYAQALVNLGNLYGELPWSDRTANLREAQACYRRALEILAEYQSDPMYCSTLLNMGITWVELPTHSRQDHLKQAIVCFEEALQLLQHRNAPRDRAQVLMHLGEVYADLPPHNALLNLDKALGYHLKALEQFKPKDDPILYGHILNAMGNIYYRIALDPQVLLDIDWWHYLMVTLYSVFARLTSRPFIWSAIRSYKRALRFSTLKAAPYDHALTQSNIGLAYAWLSRWKWSWNANKALAAYRSALTVLTAESFPLRSRETNRHLMALRRRRGEWQEVLAAADAAIEAGERLYRAGLSTKDRAVEVAENVIIYRDAAVAAARLGQAADAFLRWEAGKTRILTDILALGVQRPADVPEFIWQQFSVASAQVGYLYRTPLDAIPRNADRLNPVEAYQERVSTAHALEGQLQTAIQAVRQHAAGFLRDLDLDTIKLLLPDEATALVGFCLTNYGSLGFVVTQQSDRPVSIIEVRNFLAVHLHRLLFGLTGERDPIPGGWIMDITSVDDGRRCDALDRTLNEIGRRLLAPILTTVPTSVRRLIFLPSGGLFLLPLHAAPLMQSETERLCDRYEISYAPSVKVLATLQTGSISKTETGACMILNPENDPRLPFTACETQALLRRPEKGKRLLGRRARREAVLAAVRGCTYLHFAGHGSYHAEDPTNSGVQLADGRLTLADLWSGAADLSSARLVTLSACQTGLSDVRLGSAEEYVGLPAGFLLAGVPCVVASLWAVPDISTAILMDLFYTFHIQDQQSISAALRKAQACLRNATNSNVVDWLATQLQHADNPISALYSRYRYYRSQAKVAPDERPFHHPYYWAAFTVNGR